MFLHNIVQKMYLTVSLLKILRQITNVEVLMQSASMRFSENLC